MIKLTTRVGEQNAKKKKTCLEEDKLWVEPDLEAWIL